MKMMVAFLFSCVFIQKISASNLLSTEERKLFSEIPQDNCDLIFAYISPEDHETMWDILISNTEIYQKAFEQTISPQWQNTSYHYFHKQRDLFPQTTRSHLSCSPGHPRRKG